MMTTGTKAELLQAVYGLQSKAEQFGNREFGKDVMPLIDTLFRQDSYGVMYAGSGRHPIGSDFASPHTFDGKVGQIKFNDTIAIVCKASSGAALDFGQIRFLANERFGAGFDRMLIVSAGGFSSHSRTLCERQFGPRVELKDLAALVQWVERTPTEEGSGEDQITLILKDLLHEALMALAADATVLRHIEWRMLEQLLAKAFDKVGFNARLTPSAKDGGRDIELEWYSGGLKRTFLVEIKHWRSGKRVGAELILSFLKVVVRERADGGLMLASSGYSGILLEGMIQGSIAHVRLGDSRKIQGICKLYMRANSGLLVPQDRLDAVLTDDTMAAIGATGKLPFSRHCTPPIWFPSSFRI